VITVVVGLGFGDEGKGAIVNALARTESGPLPLVVRYNGGGQAAHNVHIHVQDQTAHHTFSQIGSASFSGCGTHLGQDFLFNPVTFLKEMDEWARRGPFSRLRISIDPLARVVTPFHMAANAAREDARGDRAHGSCAQGIGELVADYLGPRGHHVMRAGLLGDETYVRAMLKIWRDYKALDIAFLGQPVPAWFADASVMDLYVRDFIAASKLVDFLSDDRAMISHNNIIFEGAQGVLLDEDFGFHPNTTWSHVVPTAVPKMLTLRDPAALHRMGVIRTYMTRHGAGPFVTEDADIDFPEIDNGTGQYQGAFRKGHFDLVALRYAILVSGVDSLAVTHLDYLQGKNYVQVCVGYRTASGETLTDLPVLPPDDLQLRERFTESLYRMTPIYEWWPARAFLARLAIETKLPITMIGFGLRSHGLNDAENRILAGQDGFDPYGTHHPHRSAKEWCSQ
jgi:adenylosuccinate synthase